MRLRFSPANNPLKSTFKPASYAFPTRSANPPSTTGTSIKVLSVDFRHDCVVSKRHDHINALPLDPNSMPDPGPASNLVRAPNNPRRTIRWQTPSRRLTVHQF